MPSKLAATRRGLPLSARPFVTGCARREGIDSGIRVVGVEPAVRGFTKRSLAAGRRVRMPVPTTIADVQQRHNPGATTFEVNFRRVDDMLIVTREEATAAMALCFERMRSSPNRAARRHLAR